MNQKSLDKKKPKELDWEKEFDKKFGDYLELNEGMIGTAIEEYHSNATRKVKNFISRILTQQRTELLEEIKKIKIGERNENDGDDRSWNKFTYYYNQALDKVINLLNKKDE